MLRWLRDLIYGHGDIDKFFDAIERGSLLEVEHIVRDDPGIVNVTRYSGYPKPLQTAVGKGHKQIAEYLLSKGAKVFYSHAWSDLHVAASGGDPEMVKLLLDHKADVNYGNVDRERPLHWAVIKGHADAARVLIENGADINARDVTGKTPLMLALENDAADVADLLRDYGAKE